jgi:cytochrome c oxidase subunit 2
MGTTLLAIIAVVLFFTVIFFVAKANELSAEVKGKSDDYTSASNINGILFLIVSILGAIGIVYSSWVLIPRMLPEANSIHGVEVDSMFNVTTIVATIVVVVTHALLAIFVFKYRFKKGKLAYFFPHSNTLEIVWTVIPAIVLTFLVFRGIQVWNDIFRFSDIQQVEEPLIFEATAKQFGWILRYPGVDGELGERKITQDNVSSLNELGVDFSDSNSHDDIYSDKIMLVKGKPTLAKLGALDVLHGFYLPHFRVKMDCVPGLPTQFMFTPRYTTAEYREKLSKKKYWQQLNEDGVPRWQAFNFELACTELCGKSHYAMQRYVEVVTQEEYDKWLSEQTPYFEQVIKPQLEKINQTDTQLSNNQVDALEGENLLN